MSADTKVDLATRLTILCKTCGPKVTFPSSPISECHPENFSVNKIVLPLLGPEGYTKLSKFLRESPGTSHMILRKDFPVQSFSETTMLNIDRAVYDFSRPFEQKSDGNDVTEVEGVSAKVKDVADLKNSAKTDLKPDPSRALKLKPLSSLLANNGEEPRKARTKAAKPSSQVPEEPQETVIGLPRSPVVAAVSAPSSTGRQIQTNAIPMQIPPTMVPSQPVQPVQAAQAAQTVQTTSPNTRRVKASAHLPAGCRVVGLAPGTKIVSTNIVETTAEETGLKTGVYRVTHPDFPEKVLVVKAAANISAPCIYEANPPQPPPPPPPPSALNTATPILSHQSNVIRQSSGANVIFRPAAPTGTASNASRPVVLGAGTVGGFQRIIASSSLRPSILPKPSGLSVPSLPSRSVQILRPQVQVIPPSPQSNDGGSIPIISDTTSLVIEQTLSAGDRLGDVIAIPSEITTSNAIPTLLSQLQPAPDPGQSIKSAPRRQIAKKSTSKQNFPSTAEPAQAETQAQARMEMAKVISPLEPVKGPETTIISIDSEARKKTSMKISMVSGIGIEQVKKLPPPPLQVPKEGSIQCIQPATIASTAIANYVESSKPPPGCGTSAQKSANPVSVNDVERCSSFSGSSIAEHSPGSSTTLLESAEFDKMNDDSNDLTGVVRAQAQELPPPKASGNVRRRDGEANLNSVPIRAEMEICGWSSSDGGDTSDAELNGTRQQQ